jgi:hypothetical protein
MIAAAVAVMTMRRTRRTMARVAVWMRMAMMIAQEEGEEQREEKGSQRRYLDTRGAHRERGKERLVVAGRPACTSLVRGG